MYIFKNCRRKEDFSAIRPRIHIKRDERNEREKRRERRKEERAGDAGGEDRIGMS